MRGHRKITVALQAECLRRGAHEPPAELAAAYAEAVIAMQTAARERRRATNATLRRLLWTEFREAVATLLAIRRSLGLTAGERREYVGIRSARQAAAQALGDDSIFAPVSPPPGFSGKAN